MYNVTLFLILYKLRQEFLGEFCLNGFIGCYGCWTLIVWFADYWSFCTSILSGCSSNILREYFGIKWGLHFSLTFSKLDPYLQSMNNTLIGNVQVCDTLRGKKMNLQPYLFLIDTVVGNLKLFLRFTKVSHSSGNIFLD